MLKDKILEFLSTCKHLVISTSSLEGKPEAAFIGFAETENLELIFGTYNTSRKYKNLQENPRAAFVITDISRFITVQYEGTVHELTKEEEAKYVSPFLHKKIPGSAMFAKNPAQRHFLVTPTWIRYSDLSEGENIEEMTF